VDSEEGQKENDSGTATQARERRVDDSNRVKTSPPTQVTADRDVVNQLTQLRMKELLRKRMNASDHEVSKANKQITRLNPKVNGHEVEFPPPLSFRFADIIVDLFQYLLNAPALFADQQSHAVPPIKAVPCI